MKCIEVGCNQRAEHIFLVYGCGGSLCDAHMKIRRERQAEKDKKFLEKIEEISKRIDEGKK